MKREMRMKMGQGEYTRVEVVFAFLYRKGSKFKIF